jgi:histidine triad (HIT) family protein
VSADIVFEDEISMAFLDMRPVFPGHTLLIPKQHLETLPDLPHEITGHFFESAKLVTRGVESGVGAEGSFVAINNRISQSVPHLHVHIVPRRKKDGLKGFFWPRNPYPSDEEKFAVAERIRAAIASLL